MKRIYFLLGALCCFSFFVQAESPANPVTAKVAKDRRWANQKLSIS